MFEFNKETNNIINNSKFPIDLQIKRCFGLTDDQLIAISGECDLLFLKPNEPYEKIKTIKFWNRKTPTEIPLAYCELSENKKYLVCSGFTKNIVIIDLSTEDNKVEYATIEDVYIMDMIKTKTENIFVFLVAEKNSDDKYIVFYDISKKIIIEKNSILSGTKHIVDIDGTICYYGDDFIVIDNKNIVIEYIISMVWNLKNQIIVQFLNGDIYFLINNELILQEKFPLICELKEFNDGIILCISEAGNVFLVNDNFGIIQEIPLNSYVTNSIFFKKELII